MRINVQVHCQVVIFTALTVKLGHCAKYVFLYILVKQMR